MKLQTLQETTKWDYDRIGYYVPNHVYLVRGNQILAYIKGDTTLPIYFKHPMNFDRRGRTFSTVNKQLFDLSKVNL